MEIAIAAKILTVGPSAVVSFGLAPCVLGAVTPAVLASRYGRGRPSRLHLSGKTFAELIQEGDHPELES
jgi:hypothetical protein